MNCLLLISVLVALGVKSTKNEATSQASKTDFVMLIPDQRWHLAPEENKTEMINFAIKSGYHIQANQPLDDNLIATELSLSSPKGISIDDPIFDDAVSFQLKNDPNAMLVFYGNMIVEIPVTIEKNMKAGNYQVTGLLKYQACDSVKCYYPRVLSFEIPVEIK